MEKMVAEYGEQAKEAGVYIIPSCGFDCIPNDLGSLLLQKTFNGDLAYVESYICVHNTVFSSSGALYCVCACPHFLVDFVSLVGNSTVYCAIWD